MDILTSVLPTYNEEQRRPTQINAMANILSDAAPAPQSKGYAQWGETLFGPPQPLLLYVLLCIPKIWLTTMKPAVL